MIGLRQRSDEEQVGAKPRRRVLEARRDEGAARRIGGVVARVPRRARGEPPNVHGQVERTKDRDLAARYRTCGCARSEGRTRALSFRQRPRCSHAAVVTIGDEGVEFDTLREIAPASATIAPAGRRGSVCSRTTGQAARCARTCTAAPTVTARPNSVRRVRSADTPGHEIASVHVLFGPFLFDLEAVAKPQCRPFLDDHTQRTGADVSAAPSRGSTEISTRLKRPLSNSRRLASSQSAVRKPIARLQPHRPPRDIFCHRSQAGHGDLLDDLPRTFVRRKDDIDGGSDGRIVSRASKDAVANPRADTAPAVACARASTSSAR